MKRRRVVVEEEGPRRHMMRSRWKRMKGKMMQTRTMRTGERNKMCKLCRFNSFIRDISTAPSKFKFTATQRRFRLKN